MSRALDGRPVLVTGAGGCVGSLVVEELLASGRRVIAADRPGAEVPAAGDPRVEVRAVDLRRPEDCALAARGAGAAIHTAAVVDVARSLADLADINVHAVRHLHRALVAEGARAWVHFSTGSVYAPLIPPATAFDEAAAVAPSNDYVRSKLLSEDYVRRAPGPRVAVLRPSLIFGPRGKVLAAALATVPPMLGALRTALPFRGGARSNWVHARDVARAAVFLLDRPAPHGEVYNVANDDVLTLGEILGVALRAGGVETAGPAVPLSAGLFRALAPLADSDQLFVGLNRLALARWTGLRDRHALTADLAPRLDREALPYAHRDAVFSNSKLKALGFSLTFPDFASGWADTVRWYRAARWIPAAA